MTTPSSTTGKAMTYAEHLEAAIKSIEAWYHEQFLVEHDEDGDAYYTCIDKVTERKLRKILDQLKAMRGRHD